MIILLEIMKNKQNSLKIEKFKNIKQNKTIKFKKVFKFKIKIKRNLNF